MTRTHIARLLAIAMLSVVVACGEGDGDGSPMASGDDGVTFEVALLDTMEFEPSVLTVAPGDDVTVVVTNEGTEPHNFSIATLEVSQDVAPGDTVTITFSAPSSPGEHKIHCSVPGHEGAGQTGTLVVQR